MEWSKDKLQDQIKKFKCVQQDQFFRISLQIGLNPHWRLFDGVTTNILGVYLVSILDYVFNIVLFVFDGIKQYMSELIQFKECVGYQVISMYRTTLLKV